MSYTHNPNLPKPEEVLPHRPPHLWLDGVTVANASYARGFWTPGDEHFAGHFEGMPLLPGVKQIESVAQLGAYTLLLDSEEPVLGLFKGIKDTEFKRPIKPGETLGLFVEFTNRRRRDFEGVGIVEVSGELACRTTIVGTLLPERVARRMLS